MLKNLNDNLCISRFGNKEHDLWACYKPLSMQAHTKRQMWSPITGLLSTTEMHRYLNEHYQDETVSDKFGAISTRSQN